MTMSSKTCVKCNNELAANQKFCNRCGAKVADATPSPAPIPPQSEPSLTQTAESVTPNAQAPLQKAATPTTHAKDSAPQTELPKIKSFQPKQLVTLGVLAVIALVVILKIVLPSSPFKNLEWNSGDLQVVAQPDGSMTLFPDTQSPYNSRIKAQLKRANGTLYQLDFTDTEYAISIPKSDESFSTIMKDLELSIDATQLKGTTSNQDYTELSDKLKLKPEYIKEYRTLLLKNTKVTAENLIITLSQKEFDQLNVMLSESSDEIISTVLNNKIAEIQRYAWDANTQYLHPAPNVTIPATPTNRTVKK